MSEIIKSRPICDEVQTHNHEFQGSTMLATVNNISQLLHNHRFAGTTSQVQPNPTKDNPRNHTHTIFVNTDFFFNHFHEISVETGLVIPILDPETGYPIGHTHAIVGESSRVFCHEHEFKSNTLIENPIDGPLEPVFDSCTKTKFFNGNNVL